MSIDTMTRAANVARSVGSRLRPVYVGSALSGFVLWVPVEKLFMSSIGFTATSVGVMAAAYAAVVPLLGVPSGIVADRWSRKWLLVAGSVALALAAQVGALAHDVTTYIVSAMLLGVFIALYTGTLDSIVYDAVVEETGSGEGYERRIGRVRLIDSAALVSSSLAGGVLAELTSTRLMYWLSVPFALAAAVAYAALDEPQLHRQDERVPLREHAATTMRAMRSIAVRRVLVVAALTAMLSQVIFEFGPLWLVAMHAPAALYGPYWAALVGTIGVGGFVAGRLRLRERATSTGLAALLLIASLTLAVSRSLPAVIASQAAMALLLGIVGVHAGALLHEAVPSTIRAGVSAGAGTLSWIAFLPFSLAFGALTRQWGVEAAGWVLAATSSVLVVLLVRTAGDDIGLRIRTYRVGDTGIEPVTPTVSR